MVLRNKDGSPYAIWGPNPLTLDQEWLGIEELTLHNFEWEDKILADEKVIIPQIEFGTTVVVKAPTPPIVSNIATIVQEEVEQEDQKQEEQEQEEQEQEEQEQEEQEIEIVTESPKPKFRNSVIVKCLPFAGWKITQDEFYGDQYKTPRYGSQFTFEAIVIERGDLAISLWTSATLTNDNETVDVQSQTPVKSIIYPSMYTDGVKFGEYRWWKIESISTESGGLLIVAIITDIQPDFT